MYTRGEAMDDVARLRADRSNREAGHHTPGDSIRLDLRRTMPRRHYGLTGQRGLAAPRVLHHMRELVGHQPRAGTFDREGNFCATSSSFSGA